MAHLQLSPTPLLILKVFSPLRLEQQAPGEGIVELFYNACGGYIELEVQGAYERLHTKSGPELMVRTLALDPPSSIDREDYLSLARWVKSLAAQLVEGMSL